MPNYSRLIQKIHGIYSSPAILLFLKIFLMTIWLGCSRVPNALAQQECFKSGEVWLGTGGDTINAHGAGLMYHDGVYYLYGEFKKGKTWLVPGQGWECYRAPAGGVSCYSSKDLLNWKFEGLALRATSSDPLSDLDTGNVIERPKIVYNKKTKQFVMWMHIDSKDYSYARAGVAISDSPTGPFHYKGSVRPNGNMSRDMTIFKDDDERAYHFYSSEDNRTMRICLLSDDYLSHTKQEKRILIGQSREAPVVFKFKGKYYLITSGTTGWDPNPAGFAVSDSILGTWVQKGNPCVGQNGDKTFFSQGTYVFPTDVEKGKFVFLGDRWNKHNLQDSRMVWLPLVMKEDLPEIRWEACWKGLELED
jgi:hypothetical protein